MIEGFDITARTIKPAPDKRQTRPRTLTPEWNALLRHRIALYHHMTRHATLLAILALSLALPACAPSPPPRPPATPAQPPAPAPPFNKPVRMNGRGKLSSISLDDFFTLQQSGKALIYDARPAFFYHLGHVPGAISLPKNHCDESINAREAEIKAALAAGKTIIVYCTSFTCPDARTVAIHIAGFGYPAKIFSGGWEAWREADMPGE